LRGTNAYSGAINLVLKDSGNQDGSSSNITLGVGEHKGKRLGINHRYKKDEFELFFALNIFDEDGELEQLTDSDGIEGSFYDFRNNTNSTLKLTYNQHALLLNYYEEQQSKLGVDPLYAKALGRPQTLSGYLLNYNLSSSINEQFNLESGVSYDFNEREFPKRGIDDPLDKDLVSIVKGYRFSAYSKGIYEYSEQISFDFGVDYDKRVNLEYISVNPTSGDPAVGANLEDREIDEYSLFTQAEYRRSKFTYLLGSRYTHNQFYDDNVSSRGTILYEINQRNSLKFIAGQSYRAPSSFEVFFQSASNSLSGNANLEPEKSTSIEIAYLTQFNELFVQTVIYHAEYENKIYRQRVFTLDQPNLELADGTLLSETGRSSTLYYQNGNTFSTQGLELEVKYRFKHGNLFSNYSYTEGNNNDDLGDDHYNFKYPPKSKLISGVSYSRSGYFTSAILTYYSSMQAVTETIAAQSKWDLNFGYRQQYNKHKIRHVFSVKNLFDDEISGPDYVDREETFQTIRWGQSRHISYTFSMDI